MGKFKVFYKCPECEALIENYVEIDGYDNSDINYYLNKKDCLKGPNNTTRIPKYVLDSIEKMFKNSTRDRCDYNEHFTPLEKSKKGTIHCYVLLSFDRKNLSINKAKLSTDYKWPTGQY